METKDQWEYASHRIYSLTEADADAHSTKLLTELLNEYGRQGWELVAVTGNNTHIAYFKRRLID